MLALLRASKGEPTDGGRGGINSTRRAALEAEMNAGEQVEYGKA